MKTKIIMNVMLVKIFELFSTKKKKKTMDYHSLKTLHSIIIIPLYLYF